MIVKGVFITLLLALSVSFVFDVASSQNLGLAPDSVFTTIKGNKIRLKELQGKPIVITFWATDCATCVQEIPHLIKIYQQFQPQGLEMIAVAMYYDLPNHIAMMSQAKQIPYPIALDLTANHAKSFNNTQLIPATFLISPTGFIVMQKTGAIDFIDLQQRIQKFL